MFFWFVFSLCCLWHFCFLTQPTWFINIYHYKVYFLHKYVYCKHVSPLSTLRENEYAMPFRIFLYVLPINPAAQSISFVSQPCQWFSSSDVHLMLCSQNQSFTLIVSLIQISQWKITVSQSLYALCMFPSADRMSNCMLDEWTVTRDKCVR